MKINIEGLLEKYLPTKLLTIWDRLTVIYETLRDNPKKSLVAFVLAVVAIYGSYVAVFHRAPTAVKCWYEASFIDDMPDDKWRFNWGTFQLEQAMSA